MSVLVPTEGIPTTGLYQSFNGKIFLGDFPIIRIERASFTVAQNPEIYREVGRRDGIVYARSIDVRGSLSRAFVNGAEIRLAMGMKVGAATSVFKPGVEYFGQPLVTLLLEGDNIADDGRAYDQSGNQYGNTYPIKTVGKFEVNSVDGVPIQSGSEFSVGSMLVGIIHGLMIESFALNLGSGGDRINIGPVEMRGEYVDFSTIEHGNFGSGVIVS